MKSPPPWPRSSLRKRECDIHTHKRNTDWCLEDDNRGCTHLGALKQNTEMPTPRNTLDDIYRDGAVCLGAPAEVQFGGALGDGLICLLIKPAMHHRAQLPYNFAPKTLGASLCFSWLQFLYCHINLSKDTIWRKTKKGKEGIGGHLHWTLRLTSVKFLKKNIWHINDKFIIIMERFALYKS